MEAIGETQLTEPQLFDSTELELDIFSSEDEKEVRGVSPIVDSLAEDLSPEGLTSSQIAFSSQRQLSQEEEEELDNIFGKDTDEESQASESPSDDSHVSDAFSLSSEKRKKKHHKSKRTRAKKTKETSGNDEMDTSFHQDKDEGNADEEKEEEDREEEMGEDKPKDPMAINSVVAAEIEIVKRIEQGPSEAELRRRRLIELDEDELEEKTEQLNKRGLEIISQATGYTKAQRRQRLIDCRTFLSKIWKSERDEDLDHAEFIELTIDKQGHRLYGYDIEVPFDAIAYLEKENYSSDEEGAEEEGKKLTEEKKEEMIALSDSEEEEDPSEEEDNGGNTTDPSISPQSQGPSPITNSNPINRVPSDPRQQFRKYLLQQHRQQKLIPRQSRAALLFSLRQKVHETARENYCHQKKIAKEDLALRLEIAERCRQLVEILKERHEEKTIQERETRRQKYQAMAGDDDEEFDEDMVLPEGKFLTEEEKEQLLRQFNAEFSEEEEDEEEDDEDQDNDSMDLVEEKSDAGDDVGVDRPETVLEELEANEHLAAHDTKLEKKLIRQEALRRQVSSSAVSTVEDEDMEVEKEGEVEEEEEGVMKIASVLRELRGKTEEGMDEEEEKEEDEEKHSLRQFRRKASQREEFHSDDENETMKPPRSSSTVLDEPEDTMVNSDHEREVTVADEEEVTIAPEKVKKSKKVTTGNALFRLQLEEEERRLRRQQQQRQQHNLFDDEAEEEEEEGYQAGLGDFGFGVISKHKENEEEKEALRLRKGDLDHIVDSISDDEGDEEAAMKMRAEMERKEDQDRTKMVITAVTEGVDAVKSKQRKMGFSFEELVGGKKKNVTGETGEGGEEMMGEGETAEEELDFEEMLQRGLTEKLARERQFRRGGRRNGGDYDDDISDDDDEEDDEDGYNTEEEMERMKELFSTMTEEQRRIEIENIQRRKENERLEALRRKQLEKEFKIRRELRLQAQRQQRQSQSQSYSQFHSQVQSQSQSQSFSQFYSTNSQYGNTPVITENSMSGMPTSMMNPPPVLKDITNRAPPGAIVLPTDTSASNPFGRSTTWTNNTVIHNVNVVKKKNYSLTRTNSANQTTATATTSVTNKGLFTLVTGNSTTATTNTSSSGTAMSTSNGVTTTANPLKRSFSSIFQQKKKQNHPMVGSKALKTSHFTSATSNHFVFMEMSNHGHSTMIEPSTTTMPSNPPLVRQKSTGSLASSNSGNSSLFNKLGQKSGMLKRTNTTNVDTQ